MRYTKEKIEVFAYLHMNENYRDSGYYSCARASDCTMYDDGGCPVHKECLATFGDLAASFDTKESIDLIKIISETHPELFI